jgi:dTDP-4-amino-4,6-dideoxygalactose transaminase
MNIQLFVPNFRTEECLSQIRECLDKGWTGLGFKTVEFEEKWKEYADLPHAHFLSSNSVGLHLALHIFKTSLQWKDGDEVITTPLTFISTNHAIIQSGLSPVFADVDQSLCLDPNDVINKITPRTRALIFVGIGGNIGQYEQIVQLCKEHGIILILDAAHMAGTRVKGRHVGHDADCTVFSFQAVKNLATADSGMICFKEAHHDRRARKLSWLGINKDTYARSVSQGSYKWMYDVEELGFKYHGNSIMAAIGIVSLKYLDADNSYRRQLAKWYEEGLDCNTGIQIIPVSPGCESSRHLFQVRVNDRDKILMGLNDEGIHPGVHYRDNTEYGMYSYAHGSCPIAHEASKEILSLPMHLGVSKNDTRHIVNALNKLIRVT